MRARAWREGGPCTAVGVRTAAATAGRVRRVPIKLKTGLPCDPGIPLLVTCPEEHGALRTRAPLCSLRHHGRSPSNPSAHPQTADKNAVVHLHSGIQLGHEKERNVTVCNNTDAPRGYHAKRNQSVRERQMPQEFPHTGSKEQHKHTRVGLSGSENRPVVAGGRGGFGVEGGGAGKRRSAVTEQSGRRHTDGARPPSPPLVPTDRFPPRLRRSHATAARGTANPLRNVLTALGGEPCPTLSADPRERAFIRALKSRPGHFHTGSDKGGASLR